MSLSDPTREPWSPETLEDRHKVLEALDEVLASSQFCNSRRYPALLRYVVERTLDGHGGEIKERTVGIDVFGRAPDYDTNLDTIVRYSAGEVRKRLALYYHGNSASPIMISLSARSYRPDFLRTFTPAVEVAADREVKPESSAQELPPKVLSGWRSRTAVRSGAVLLFVVALCAFFAFRNPRSTDVIGSFWNPVLRAQGPTIISLGGVVFSPVSSQGTRVAEDATQMNPYLSWENGLAMGRVAAMLHVRGEEYRVQPASYTTLAQIRENPTVQVGAYNNEWTLRLLQPLRFHFDAHPDEAIVDTQNPGRVWRRDKSKPFGDAPDYALVARFHDPTTDSILVVLAGIQRFGTDAASQFVTSPDLLREFDQMAGRDWRNKNVEVVLRVDVVNGRAGAPSVEAFYVW